MTEKWLKLSLFYFGINQIHDNTESENSILYMLIFKKKLEGNSKIYLLFFTLVL